MSKQTLIGELWSNAVAAVALLLTVWLAAALVIWVI